MSTEGVCLHGVLNGMLMEFATFEDQTGLYDATFFQSTYRQYCHLLASKQANFVTGLVEEYFAP
jgi:error-prone DNA polymerase